MEFNYFMFPKPDTSNMYGDLFKKVIYIPKKVKSNTNLVKNKNNLKNKLSNIQQVSSNNIDKFTNYQNNKKVSKIKLYQNDDSKYITDRKKRFTIDITNTGNENIDYDILDIKDDDNDNNLIINNSIPCLYNCYTYNPKYFIIYLHANAEDIFSSNKFTTFICKYFDSIVLSMEYCGYSIYKNAEAKKENIFKDLNYLMEYVLKVLKVPNNRIIILGRSLGSFFTNYLNTQYKFLFCINISPFETVKKIVSDKIGFIGHYIINDTFNNCDFVKDFKNPILFIHGKKDSLTNYSHSQNLFNLCKIQCDLILIDDMEHDKFDVEKDICVNIKNFMGKFTIDQSLNLKQLIKEKLFYYNN